MGLFVTIYFRRHFIGTVQFESLVPQIVSGAHQQILVRGIRTGYPVALRTGHFTQRPCDFPAATISAVFNEYLK